MKYTSIVGTLIYVPSAPNGTGYYFELENGEFLNIKFLCSDEEAEDVPRNARIALAISDEQTDGLYEVSDTKPFYTILRDNS